MREPSPGAEAAAVERGERRSVSVPAWWQAGSGPGGPGGGERQSLVVGGTCSDTVDGAEAGSTQPAPLPGRDSVHAPAAVPPPRPQLSAEEALQHHVPSWLKPGHDADRWKIVVTAVYCLGVASSGLIAGATGPATLKLAQQIGAVPHNFTGNFSANGTAAQPKGLEEMGPAYSVFALASATGAILGGWLVSRYQTRWHLLLAASQLWQALAWIGQSFITSYSGLMLAWLLVGIPQQMAMITSQSALTWIWGKRVAPYMQVPPPRPGWSNRFP